MGVPPDVLGVEWVFWVGAGGAVHRAEGRRWGLGSCFLLVDLEPVRGKQNNSSGNTQKITQRKRETHEETLTQTDRGERPQRLERKAGARRETHPKLRTGREETKRVVLETQGGGRGRETPRKPETRGGEKEPGMERKAERGKVKRVRNERGRRGKGLKEGAL